MEREENLRWEKEWGRPAALAAGFAVLAQLASQLIQNAALSDAGRGTRGLLLALGDAGNQVIAGRVVQVVSVLFAVASLFYLLRCTRHRRDVMPGVVGLLVLAPLLVAIGGVLTQLDLNDLADRFLSGPRTERAADRLIEDQRDPAPLFIGLAGTIALSFSYIVLSLAAMRAGLLSRFMGILGIVGAVFVVVFPPLSLIQVFWLGALAYLFFGRWPGGRGPAWETGEAVPWPTMADQRAELLRQREQEQGGGDPPVDDEPERPPSRKRKKRR